MGSIEKSAEFPVSPEKLWDVVGNPSRFDEWLNMHVKWKNEVPADLHPGVQLVQVASVLNMPNTITWTIDEYEAPRVIKLSGTGMAGVKISLTSTIAPTDFGSTVTFQTDFEGQMLVGAIGAAVEKAGLNDLDLSLAKLTTILG